MNDVKYFEMPVGLYTASGSFKGERRREYRYPAQDRVEINVLPPQGDPFPATVVDVSKSGLRLEFARSVPTQMRIEVVFPASQLVAFGEVRYRRRAGGVYHAGVLVENLVFPTGYAEEHLARDDISMYVAGEGLSTPDLVRVEKHRYICRHCSDRIADSAVKFYGALRRLAVRQST